MSRTGHCLEYDGSVLSDPPPTHCGNTSEAQSANIREGQLVEGAVLVANLRFMWSAREETVPPPPHLPSQTPAIIPAVDQRLSVSDSLSETDQVILDL